MVFCLSSVGAFIPVFGRVLLVAFFVLRGRLRLALFHPPCPGYYSLCFSAALLLRALCGPVFWLPFPHSFSPTFRIRHRLRPYFKMFSLFCFLPCFFPPLPRISTSTPSSSCVFRSLSTRTALGVRPAFLPHPLPFRPPFYCHHDPFVSLFSSASFSGTPLR